MRYNDFRPFETMKLLDAGQAALAASGRDYATFEHGTSKYTARRATEHQTGKPMLVISDYSGLIVGRRWI